ncbi:Eco57I restriction-modification methylase domain-containing protein [Staphylococcus hominis]|uniref:Eco57I restriction-modification methylase domain-containing protein n=1 Tax=Staphylococcus hominis TaxID=1290 RepID=UPI001F5A7032|nr:Eco57I restriction-modification methylase domain-containing protein [Staphylococcus hominis]MCI2877144.1 Eco57I restriction-modification methylase domain-containing protein [Staphylococcus hominis]
MPTLEKTNFYFLKDDINFNTFINPTNRIENLYRDGYYTHVIIQARQIAEAVTFEILNHEMNKIPKRTTFNSLLKILKNKNILPTKILNILYNIKSYGNISAHDIENEVDESLAIEILRQTFTIVSWLYKKYATDPKSVPRFETPKKIFNNNSQLTYETKAERKMIYVWTAKNDNGMWPAYIGSKKIGETTVANNLRADWSDNSSYLKEAANKRVKQYANTAGVPYDMQWATLAIKNDQKTWFHDYDVHNVLKRSGIKLSENLKGQEWFKTDLETVKLAIEAVRNGQSALSSEIDDKYKKLEIEFRPEQKTAISESKKVFKKKNKMLWNAKMRFGKTLSALQLIKEEQFNHVLILTHRPIVSDSWFEDFKKLNLEASGYKYGSKSTQYSINDLLKNEKFIYFVSMQDLRGSSQVGGKQGVKNDEIFSQQWDLVIIDEAHEGTQTELAEHVQNAIISPTTKILELSGTPFNLLQNYDDDQVFTWDYSMEQAAKLQWDIENPNIPNPYSKLPKVNMFTFDMLEKNKYSSNNSFNFSEFFKVNAETNEFVYKKDVMNFLNEITKNSKTNYPFSTEEFRNNLRHSLWLLPNIKSARALKSLMENHPIFGKEYKIINIVDNDDNIANEADLDRVRTAISDKPWETKTITLTVRKLTTGVNIPEWTAVIFLNNTSSPTSYLQAAFRAQTPYSDKTGEKINSYVFDFAPDRALTVMAQASQLRTAPGKRITSKQKSDMNRLLNFLPIIGVSGNKMKKFSVDSMLGQLKRVYAQKAINSGFSDDSLYSDELLLNITEEDINAFSDLKSIIGSTTSEKLPKEVKINDNGLTEEEYDKAEESKNKNKKDRTPEEQEIIDKMKLAQKNKRAMISILRGISIRIPLMIFGMNVNIEDDISIDNFIDLVDDVSWEEFMPSGITKEKFQKFTKYYDSDIFIEAGKRIRSKVQELDSLEPIERVQELSYIFGTFKNPDKETVLTPWRAVNLHLHSTIGGLSFYDKAYKKNIIDGNAQFNWSSNEIWKKDTTFLEINSKTGLYPLYIATSLYYKELMKLNNDYAGKFDAIELNNLWSEILKKNIFVIAKTPMAKSITQRTLSGYKNLQTNIIFIDSLLHELKIHNQEKIIESILRRFNMKKFDVVVGNPPYQQNIEGRSNQPSIYNYFYDLAFSIGDKVTLISPARFLSNVGDTDKNWNKKMLNNDHLKIIHFEEYSSEIFPNTQIKGGVVITYYDNKKSFGKIGTFFKYEELKTILEKVENKTSKFLSSILYSNTSYSYTNLLLKENPNFNTRLSGGSKRYASSSVFEKLPEIFYDICPEDSQKYIEIYGLQNKKRTYKYVARKYFSSHPNLDKYKVLVASSNGNGHFGETLSTPIVMPPKVGHTETFISFGAFNTKLEAENLLKYIKTKFLRTLLGIFKVTQGNKTAHVWSTIPLQDFSNHSDIDWSQDINKIDQQLYHKYNLTDEEISFIEKNVKEMM